MRLHKMKFNYWAKIIFIGLLILATFGCQNQSVSNSANNANANVATNDANNANVKIPKPRDIKFESVDKVEIVGTFYESAKSNSPAVLMLHQWQSDRNSYDEFAKRLQKNGIGVLAIDGRGFGESVKTIDDKTIEPSRTNETVEAMKADVENAFDFLAKQDNVDAERIGIVGASYGSSLALIYAAENPKVKAVALLSPGLNYFDNMPTTPAIKKYGDRPLLLVAAEDDKESAAAVRKLKSAVKNEKYEDKIFEKGGHGTGIFEANVGLRNLLEEFLTKNL